MQTHIDISTPLWSSRCAGGLNFIHDSLEIPKNFSYKSCHIHSWKFPWNFNINRTHTRLTWSPRLTVNELLIIRSLIRCGQHSTNSRLNSVSYTQIVVVCTKIKWENDLHCINEGTGINWFYYPKRSDWVSIAVDRLQLKISIESLFMGSFFKFRRWLSRLFLVHL